MSRQKSLLNEQIDKSIQLLITNKGEEGFGYGDVESRVRTALVGNPEANMQEILLELGASKFRERIRERTRAVSLTTTKGLAFVHPELIEPDAEIIYPVKGENSETIFKQLAHMTQAEISDVIRDLIVQRKGLEKHIRAIRRIERKLGHIWKNHPRLNVEEAQQYLDPAAA